MKRLIVIALCCFPMLSIGQTNMMQSKLSADKVKTDLNILFDALEEAHPGLYRYNSKTSFKAFRADILSSIEDGTTLMEMYRVIAKIVSGVHDGHTRTMLPEEVEARQKLLPMLFQFRENKMWIKHDFSGKIKDTVECELLEINGMTLRVLALETAPHLSGDGFIQSGFPHQFEVIGLPKLYYSLIGQPDTYAVLYTNGEDTIIRDIPAMVNDSLAVLFNQYSKEHMVKPLQSGFLRNEISGSKLKYPAAVLRVNSFHPPEMKKRKQNFQRYTKRFFRKLRRKKSTTLIIDLRANSGGESMYALQLFSYLTDSSFQAYKRVELAKLDSFSFEPYTDLPANFRNKRENHFRDSTGMWQLKSHPAMENWKPAKKPFTGDVYVLISGKTFSSAGIFCSLVKSHERGKFIGEETGGAYEALSAGATPIITLPNSKIKVQIPLVNIIMNVKPPDKPGRGVVPDLQEHMISNPYVQSYLENAGIAF